MPNYSKKAKAPFHFSKYNNLYNITVLLLKVFYYNNIFKGISQGFNTPCKNFTFAIYKGHKKGA